MDKREQIMDILREMLEVYDLESCVNRNNYTDKILALDPPQKDIEKRCSKCKKIFYDLLNKRKSGSKNGKNCYAGQCPHCFTNLIDCEADNDPLQESPCRKMINDGRGNESYHSWNMRTEGKCSCQKKIEEIDKKSFEIRDGIYGGKEMIFVDKINEIIRVINK